jgi:thiol-disulfide isomerase/thioredoxin
MVNRLRNSRGRFTTTPPVDVTKEEHVSDLSQILSNGRPTFIFIHAEWCGHCHTYKPTWKTLEDTPGRYANVARVHHDMVEKIPEIAESKIQGYPSIVRVNPDKTVEEFVVPGSSESTNAIPYMRDVPRMKKELVLVSPTGNSTVATIQDSRTPARQDGLIQSGGALGSVYGAFMTAIQRAGPAALLLLANNALSGRSKTYRSPKRSSKRASTRKNRG